MTCPGARRRAVLTLSTGRPMDSSEPITATLDQATLALHIADATVGSDDGAFSAVERLFPIINGPEGRDTRSDKATTAPCGTISRRCKSSAGSRRWRLTTARCAAFARASPPLLRIVLIGTVLGHNWQKGRHGPDTDFDSCARDGFRCGRDGCDDGVPEAG